MKMGIISLTVAALLASTCSIKAHAEETQPSSDSSNPPAAQQKPAKKAKPSKKSKAAATTPAASSSSEAPAASAASPSTDSSSSTSTPSKPVATSKPAVKTHSFNAAKLPEATVAFTAGVLVGMPIAIFRRCKAEGINATKELCGEGANPVIFGACAMIGIPGGCLTGVCTGTADAIVNSARNCTDEPFSKDSFSLGELKY